MFKHLLPPAFGNKSIVVDKPASATVLMEFIA